jgi:hypothetical protein
VVVIGSQEDADSYGTVGADGLIVSDPRSKTGHD